MATAFDEVLQTKLAPVVGDLVAAETKTIVDRLRAERAVNAFGKDMSGLDDEQKKEFVKQVQAVVRGDKSAALRTKANEALIEEQDNRGGFLVGREVADAILRIAASVGTVLSQAQQWTLKTDELGIPNYTGSFMTGSYLGVDAAGSVTGLVFGQVLLIAKKWQLAFVVGNDLLSDASVNLADWLLALAGEGLANMVDQQGLIGSTGNTSNGVVVGGPFTGILAASGTTQYYLGNAANSGKVHISDYDVLVDSSNAIGNLEESILDGSAFYFHRTVWAAIRVQKDTAGNFILPYAGWAPGTLTNEPGGGPVRPAGQILGYPVYTNRWLPVYSTASAAGTNFGIFGNMKALAYGDKGDMRVAQFESGSFGGKEIALTDQTGVVYKNRHGVVVALPAAFVIIGTSTS